MSGKLMQSLADLIVLVGADCNSGLKPMKASTDYDRDKEIVKTDFEPQLLAAITANTAYFPFEEPPVDPKYPQGVAQDLTLVHSRDTLTYCHQLTKQDTIDSAQFSEWFQRSSDGSSSSSYVSSEGSQSPRLPSTCVRVQRAASVDSSLSSNSDVFLPNTPGYQNNPEPREEIRKSLGSNSNDDKSPSFTSMHRRKISSVRMTPVRQISQAKRSNKSESDLESNELESEVLEMLRCLPQFCFPEGMRVCSAKKPDSIHHLVLTGVCGERFYATCLRVYKAARIQPGEEGGFEIIKLSRNKDDADVFVPCCYVMISQIPYFSVFKECLSKMRNRMRCNHDKEDEVLKLYALQLTRTITPPPGSMHLAMQLEDVRILLPSSCFADHPIIDFPLSILFFLLPLEYILQIISCMLTQHRIVIISSNYSVLTIASQALIHFIEPFAWNFPFVPILSKTTLELLDAPGSFLFGCHSQHRNEVLKISELIVVDIDERELGTCASLKLPALPQDSAYTFKRSFRKIGLHYDVANLDSTALFNINQIKESSIEHRRKVNMQISAICLELMVNLFRDVLQFIKPKTKYFDKAAFLKIQRTEDLFFYEQVLQSESFNGFLNDRFEAKNDRWTQLEEATRRKSKTSNRSFSSYENTSLRKGRSEPTALALRIAFLPPYEIWKLPEFQTKTYQFYYSSCIKQITSKLETCSSPNQRASFLCMRGILKLADNKAFSAFEDFHSLFSFNAKLFPEKIAKAAYDELSEQDVDVLKEKRAFHKSELFMIMNCNNAPLPSRYEEAVKMKWDRIPTLPVSLSQFREVLDALDIHLRPVTSQTLFDVLCMCGDDEPGCQVVYPEVFEVFYTRWKEQEVKRTNVLKTVNSDNIEIHEYILKCSEMIKTDYGNGRIILTSKRIHFLQEGSKKCSEVGKLYDIVKVEKIIQKSFVTNVPALKLHFRNKMTFAACFKEDRDEWYWIIMEMHHGKMAAEEVRNLSIVSQASSNVQLIISLFQSKDEIPMSPKTLNNFAQHLAHFFTERQYGNYTLTEITKQNLLQVIDPNDEEKERKSVESLLYMTGVWDSGDIMEPKLWVGMGSGKVFIYDASTWIVTKVIELSSNRIVFILGLGDQVWAASLDATIYVVNKRTLQSNYRLVGHSDAVTSLCYHKPTGTVYSSCINGEIVCWEQSSLQQKKKFTNEKLNCLRSIQIFNNHLWCCSKNYLLKLSLEGESLLTIEGGSYNLYQFAITTDIIFVGCEHKNEIRFYNTSNGKQIRKATIESCKGVRSMILFKDHLWFGTHEGRVIIMEIKNPKKYHALEFHKDSVRCMTNIGDRYIATGSADGRYAVWRSDFSDSRN